MREPQIEFKLGDTFFSNIGFLKEFVLKTPKRPFLAFYVGDSPAAHFNANGFHKNRFCGLLDLPRVSRKPVENFAHTHWWALLRPRKIGQIGVNFTPF